MIVSPKLKKIFDVTDPPAKKAFFGGGSVGLKAKDLGYVSGRKYLLLPYVLEQNKKPFLFCVEGKRDLFDHLNCWKEDFIFCVACKKQGFFYKDCSFRFVCGIRLRNVDMKI